MAHEAADVADFYDSITASSLQYGQGASTSTIHRAVWGEGVTSRDEAFHFVHRLILEELDQVAAEGERANVLDLGCGVGATLFYLAQRRSVHGIGVTNSPLQCALARRFVTDLAEPLAGCASELEFAEGDMCRLETCRIGDETLVLPKIDVAFSIEAFLHGDDPARYLANAASALRPGGRLILCDDFRSERAADDAQLTRREAKWLADFQRGWHVSSLLSVARVEALARQSGLTLQRSLGLNEWLELNRPRDVMIRILTGLFGWLPISHPRWLALVGGNALQRCLLNGLLEYRFLVIQKS